MSLLAREKANYANIPNGSVGVLNAATAGALGSDTNGVACYTAGAYGGRVESLVASTDDTAAVNLFVYILDGSTVKPLGIVNVPLSSGNLGTVANVDLLAGTGITLLGMLIDASGKRYISLKANEVLKVSCLANMTAAKKCHVTSQGFDFTTT